MSPVANPMPAAAPGEATGAETAERPVSLPEPSKTARDENFPVGSRLLPAALRPHVAAFYAFARTADDVADSPDLSRPQKLRLLDDMAAALGEPMPGHGDLPAVARMRASLRETGVTDQHCRDLLAAFRQDAVTDRYAGWADLLDYCLLSAAPVGRYLLDLHGEPAALYSRADPLCNALQILNHLQDAKADYLALDRVYLPTGWLAASGAVVEDLAAVRASPAIRQTLDRVLDGVAALLDEARALPGLIDNRRLAAEVAVILALAERLMARLRHGDPIARRVALSRFDFVMAGLSGVTRTLLRAGLRAGRIRPS